MSAGAVIALIAGQGTITRSAIIGLVVAGAAGTIWVAWEHQWLRTKLRTCLILAATLVGTFLFAWMAWPVKSHSPVAETEIYIECHLVALPIHVSSGTTAHVKVFNKKQYINTKQMMFDIWNDGIQEQLWPDSKLINSVKDNPSNGYECDLTNHAQANLIDLAVSLPVHFGQEKQEFVHTIIISPLDAGKTFTFYLINECSVPVEFIALGSVEVQVFGEDQRRTVPLRWPHRNPMEQMFIFLPSKIRWTGNVCE